MAKKILLVDDDTDILEIVGYNLSQEGYQISTAINGRDAIAKAKKVLPHLIIMDVMMPKMDGYEVCSKIRSMGGYESLPIIFLTAKGGEIDEVHGYDEMKEKYPFSTPS